jgi:molybdate transport system ATP-binding protein
VEEQKLMGLEIAIRHSLGELQLDVAFKSPARVVALFGSSGAGKTSIANIIAGLMKPHYARIVVDGEVLCDTERGVFVSPSRRRIGLVFQETRLFPHLTVAQNLSYGSWFSKVDHGVIDKDQLVALLGLQSLLARRPSELSGGEKQRVAIGRAVLSNPRLLIMDEPLASLDGPRKNEILSYIERLRDALKLQVIYVSHSRDEIARLGGDVVVLADGKLTGFGPPAKVFRA